MKNLAQLEMATMKELSELDKGTFFEYWTCIQECKKYIKELEEKLNVAIIMSGREKDRWELTKDCGDQ